MSFNFVGNKSEVCYDVNETRSKKNQSNRDNVFMSFCGKRQQNPDNNTR